MNLTMAIPLAVALIGAIVHLLSNSKWAELGRISYFCGLLVFLFMIAGRVLHISA